MFITALATRFALSFSYFFLSIILGALAMGLFWYHLPDQFVQLQRTASLAREWIAEHAWSTRTESILRFLLEDRQLLLITFVLAMRLILGFFLGLLLSLGAQVRGRLGTR